jgi:hypothetical protein
MTKILRRFCVTNGDMATQNTTPQCTTTCPQTASIGAETIGETATTYLIILAFFRNKGE